MSTTRWRAFPHDGEILLRWLVRRWLAYEHQAPGLYAQQQADLEAIPEDEVEAAGMWLIADHPELDVEMVFDMENPLPSLTRIPERLALKHRVALWMSHGASPEVRELFQKHPPLWRQGPTSSRLGQIASTTGTSSAGASSRWFRPT